MIARSAAPPCGGARMEAISAETATNPAALEPELELEDAANSPLKSAACTHRGTSSRASLTTTGNQVSFNAQKIDREKANYCSNLVFCDKYLV